MECEVAGKGSCNPSFSLSLSLSECHVNHETLSYRLDGSKVVRRIFSFTKTAEIQQSASIINTGPAIFLCQGYLLDVDIGDLVHEDQKNCSIPSQPHMCKCKAIFCWAR
jgi:hypothetical protein